jgi:hypothetical protein
LLAELVFVAAEFDRDHPVGCDDSSDGFVRAVSSFSHCPQRRPSTYGADDGVAALRLRVSEVGLGDD